MSSPSNKPILLHFISQSLSPWFSSNSLFIPDIPKLYMHDLDNIPPRLLAQLPSDMVAMDTNIATTVNILEMHFILSIFVCSSISACYVTPANSDLLHTQTDRSLWSIHSSKYCFVVIFSRYCQSAHVLSMAVVSPLSSSGRPASSADLVCWQKHLLSRVIVFHRLRPFCSWLGGWPTTNYFYQWQVIDQIVWLMASDNRLSTGYISFCLEGKTQTNKVNKLSDVFCQISMARDGLGQGNFIIFVKKI